LAKQKTIVRYYPSTKKRSYRRRRVRRRIRRAAPSILKIAGVAGSFFVAPEGRTPPAISIKNAIQDPNWGWHNALGDLLVNYTGYDVRFGTWHMPTGLLVIALGSIAGKIVGKFAGSKPFRGIPFLSRYKM